MFGCPHCYGDDAAETAVWYANGGLVTERYLVDEPHFGVSVRRCRECRQAFVDVFTEFVNWEGGDDSQYRDVVPATAEELAALPAGAAEADLAFLGELGARRRRLSTSWPADSEKQSSWQHGTFWILPGR